MNYSGLFISTQEECHQVSSYLVTCGCCARCVLRFLGVTNHTLYLSSFEEIKKDYLGQDAANELSESVPCPACLGVLQKYSEKPFFDKIASAIEKEKFEFIEHMCSLQLPVSLIIREKALMLALKKKFGVFYKGKEASLPSVKDAWKWVCGPGVSERLGSQFQNRGIFDIKLTFDYADSDKECSFLLDAFPDTFRRRKQRKFGFETFTRANVARAITDMKDSKFEDCVKCPPPLPTTPTECSMAFLHQPIFVAGRYMKYSRVLSQSPWIVDGQRVMEGSVQELLTQPILDAFRPTDHRLSSSGREDVDVRMLGLGRPFVVELINPHASGVTDVKAVQKEINDSTKDIQVRDLQIVARVDTNKLKEGETDKTKSYCAFCWCEKDLSQSELDAVENMKELTLQQKTPLRVLHRRSVATRPRIIHSMKAYKTAPHRFSLRLTTQAGTYIKEFVHGDFGRTEPSLGTLLGTETDITALDVESVDVEWPPFIDPIDTTNGKIEKCSDDSEDKDNSSKQKVLIQQDSTSSMNQQENGSSDIPR